MLRRFLLARLLHMFSAPRPVFSVVRRFTRHSSRQKSATSQPRERKWKLVKKLRAWERASAPTQWGPSRCSAEIRRCQRFFMTVMRVPTTMREYGWGAIIVYRVSLMATLQRQDKEGCECKSLSRWAALPLDRTTFPFSSIKSSYRGITEFPTGERLPTEPERHLSDFPSHATFNLIKSRLGAVEKLLTTAHFPCREVPIGAAKNLDKLAELIASATESE